MSHGYTLQAFAGLISVREGTLVVYRSRVCTERVAGFGSSIKKSIGRSIMAKQLTDIFQRSRDSLPAEPLNFTLYSDGAQTYMDPAHFSAFAALAGSTIGGLTSLATSWLIQHAQFRAQQLAHDITRREELYKDFN